MDIRQLCDGVRVTRFHLEHCIAFGVDHSPQILYCILLLLYLLQGFDFYVLIVNRIKSSVDILLKLHDFGFIYHLLPFVSFEGVFEGVEGGDDLFRELRLWEQAISEMLHPSREGYIGKVAHDDTGVL